MLLGHKLVNISAFVPSKCLYVIVDFSMQEKSFRLPFKVQQLFSCFTITSFWPHSANSRSLLSPLSSSFKYCVNEPFSKPLIAGDVLLIVQQLFCTNYLVVSHVRHLIHCYISVTAASVFDPLLSDLAFFFPGVILCVWFSHWTLLSLWLPCALCLSIRHSPPYNLSSTSGSRG